MRERLLFLALAVVPVLAACSPAATPCDDDDQCPSSMQCAAGRCTARCDPACESGELCDSGKCWPQSCGAMPCPDDAFCYQGQCTLVGCRGKVCGENRVCTYGGQCAEKNCKDQPCGEGEACAGGEVCADVACIGIRCGAMQHCFRGACRDDDCGGRSCGKSFCADGIHCRDCPSQACPGEQVCIANACQPSVCATRPDSELCLNACRAAGRPCGPTQVCVDGRCAERDCPEQACPAGTFCGLGGCVGEACAGVVCPSGEACSMDGACRPTRCGSSMCPQGQVCDRGACVSSLCAGVVCQTGSECFAGSCYEKKGCPEGQLWIEGACRKGYPKACKPACAAGFDCKEGACVSAVCQGVVCDPGFRCVGGACLAVEGCLEGSVSIGGQCLSTSCDDGPCPDGWLCVQDVCVSPSCLGVFCTPPAECWGGACRAPDGCPEGQVKVDGVCTDVHEPQPCGAVVCQEGWYCDAGTCEAACDSVVCPAGQGCYAGTCFPVEDCLPGQVKVAGACRPQGPPPSCSYVRCDPRTQACVDGACVPFDGCPEGQALVDGECTPVPEEPCPTVECSGECCVEGATCGADGKCIGDPECFKQPALCETCGPTSCRLPDKKCDHDRCIDAQCEHCGPGYACMNPGAPPCKAQGCLGVTCPPYQHCVPGPTPEQPGVCQFDECPLGGDEPDYCSEYEECKDGACIESVCRNVTCKAGERCLLGKCVQACCPGAECTSQTICLEPITFFPDCPSHDCGQGQVCWGDTCNSNLPGCYPEVEERTCDRIDADCSGTTDDFTFLDYAIAFVPASDTATYVRKPWGRCDVSDPDKRDCVRSFTDGLNVYLMQGDSVHERTPGTPTFVDRAGDKHEESSCLELTPSCPRLRFTALTFDAHGAQTVPGTKDERECIQELDGLACLQTFLDVFVMGADSNRYKSLCSQKQQSDRTIRLTCPPLVSAPSLIKKVLVCRRLPASGDAHPYQHIAIEGISLSGCCE